jgi:hypothetical protein
LGGVAIAHDENVTDSIAARAEGVGEDTARLEDDFRVITRGLVGGASVKVPLGKGRDALGLLGKRNKVRKGFVTTTEGSNRMASHRLEAKSDKGRSR